MSEPSDPPFRSLLRPENLLDGRARHTAGDSDGEFRPASWHMDVIHAIDDITTVTDQNTVVHFRKPTGARTTPRRPARRRPAEHRPADLRRGQTAKLTIPSPSVLHTALERKDDLKRRIDEAATSVPLEQLALSGQCGFSSQSKAIP